MRIFTQDEPIMKLVCSEVHDDAIEGYAKIAKEAAELMYETNGCGIAAPQVGLDKRFCVVDVWWKPDEEGSERKPMFLFNPVIKSASEETEADIEGCLSVVGVHIEVERPKEVSVEYTNELGERVEMEADGRLARCLQHEIDHLDGITIVDHLSGIDKIRAFSALDDAAKGGKGAGTSKVVILRGQAPVRVS